MTGSETVTLAIVLGSLVLAVLSLFLAAEAGTKAECPRGTR